MCRKCSSSHELLQRRRGSEATTANFRMQCFASERSVLCRRHALYFTVCSLPIGICRRSAECDPQNSMRCMQSVVSSLVHSVVYTLCTYTPYIVCVVWLYAPCVWRVGVRTMNRCGGSCLAAACCITPPPPPPSPGASCTAALPGHRHRYTSQLPSSRVLSTFLQ